MAKSHRRQSLKKDQPFAPTRFFGYCSEFIQYGQGEASQVSKVRALAFEVVDFRRIRFVKLDRLDFPGDLSIEPVEPTLPAVAPPNNCRLDQELLPFPRCTDRSGYRWCVFIYPLGRRFWCRRFCGVWFSRQKVVIGHDPLVSWARRGAAVFRIWYLT